jgi:hypothetical protein
MDRAPRFAERLMAAEVRASNPRSGRIITKFIGERALESDVFLAERMLVEANAHSATGYAPARNAKLFSDIDAQSPPPPTEAAFHRSLESFVRLVHCT